MLGGNIFSREDVPDWDDLEFLMAAVLAHAVAGPRRGDIGGADDLVGRSAWCVGENQSA